MAPPDFGISVKPISITGQNMPPHHYWHARIFRPSDGPICTYYVVCTSTVRGGQREEYFDHFALTLIHTIFQEARNTKNALREFLARFSLFSESISKT